jgi:flagellar motor switch/type III secretory pathway protein FliN
LELRLASPLDAVIGLGLARDPAPPAEVRLAPAALDGVPVALTARLARKRVAARTLADFNVGTVVAFDAALGDPAALLVGEVVVAHGECGVHKGFPALRITAKAKAGETT